MKGRLLVDDGWNDLLGVAVMARSRGTAVDNKSRANSEN